jgi:lipoprotein-anchoring transpeptidase ErfK/SrfK
MDVVGVLLGNTEVLMGRTRTRISRGLIAALAVVLVLGLIFYFHNSNKTNASQTKGPDVAAAKTVVAVHPPAATPSTQPTIQISATPSNISAQPGVAITQTPAISVGGPAAKPAPNAAISQQQSAPKATPVAISSNKPLVDGKARVDAGDLLGARRVLNTALVSGNLNDADQASAKALLSEISKTVVFSSKRFADDEFGGSYSVQSGESLQKIARQHDVTWELLCRLNGLSDPRRLRAGATIKVLKGPMHAVVSKSKFTMDIYFGSPGGPDSMYVTTFGVGLGRDDSTPTGKWMVEPQRKIKNPVYYSPRGEGIIDADDPKNPLGEYWLGLTGIDGHAVGKMSYGIHGTIEPASIGKQASMGCIRMHNEDVAQVFELLVEGKSTVAVQD